MFRSLQLKRTPHIVAPDPAQVNIHQIIGDAHVPIAIRNINNLPDNAKIRIYRTLIAPELLTQFDIKPNTWQGLEKKPLVQLVAPPETNKVQVSVFRSTQAADPFFYLELQDNAYNSIDLNLILLNNPESPYFQTDFDESGIPTQFGAARRNLEAEHQAMLAGLAPGQTRASLGASKLVLQHIETFLTAMAHYAYYLEPLTYASAWIFERRGFAYVRGHKLMEDIHREFIPGGKLHQALDGSTPFRQPGQYQTVRGRAWAIHDGILEVIGEKWNHLRMVKQIGKQAGVETFPEALY